MPIPNFKVNIIHDGVSTDYINNVFRNIQIKRRENNYDVATLSFPDAESKYYEDYFSKFDEVKIYFKDASELSWTTIPQFGGNIRQIIPTMNQMGFLPQLTCKGYGAALDVTHCNRDYGIESSWPSFPKPWNIVKNAIADFVERSLSATVGSGTLTGWDIDNTYVSDYCDTNIKYINNPYRTNLELMNLVCQLTSAIGAGTTAGAHWIVDNSKRFLFAKIGDHAAGATSPEEWWPDWWNTGTSEAESRALSTLEQGTDFTEYTLPDKSDEFANKVVLITDFRRPVFDYWTDGVNCDALWGNAGMDSIDSEETIKIVGSHSLKFTETGVGYAYYPTLQDAAWDVTRWGSPHSVPYVNFYMRKTNNDMAVSSIRMCTTTYNDRFFECLFNTWSVDDDKWIHISIPVGDYWESTQESRQYRWVPQGAPDPVWTTINAIAFCVATSEGTATLYVDDLHFSGKITRSACNSWSILGNADPLVKAKNEYQKVLISRNAMDDSCVAGVGAGKDDGFAARIAYAELLRRQKRPKTIIFSTTRDMKNAMAGQKIHVHVCRKADGSFRSTGWDNGGDMRILELQEDLSAGGILYTVTATTDLLNSTPISVPDQYAMWMENMFLNSKEAKNIRAGSEVDLLIPILESEYNSDDD